MAIKITSPGLTQTDADARYVNITGDSMTGDLEFLDSTKGVILESLNATIVAGNPVGLLLALTYAASTGTTKRWRVTVNDSGNLVTTQL